MATTKTQTQSTQTEWIDEMTYQAGVHIEKGKQRSHTLRGERSKTKATEKWADKQEVKAQRQEVQLETEKIKLQTDKEKKGIAETNLKGTQAAGVLNEIGWRQRLVKKSYAVGINPGSMAKAIAPTTKAIEKWANYLHIEMELAEAPKFATLRGAGEASPFGAIRQMERDWIGYLSILVG